MGDVCTVGPTSRLQTQISAQNSWKSTNAPHGNMYFLTCNCLCFGGNFQLESRKTSKQNLMGFLKLSVSHLLQISSMLSKYHLGTRGRFCTKNDLLFLTSCAILHQFSEIAKSQFFGAARACPATGTGVDSPPSPRYRTYHFKILKLSFLLFPFSE